MNENIKTTEDGMELDELDRRILRELQQNAAQTNLELAQKVHASPPTCLRRVKRLTESGVIARQVALLAPGLAARGLCAIVEISLDHQGAEYLDKFEEVAAAAPEVMQCYRVSPGPDFVLVLQVADMPAYHALAHRLFATHANVRNVKTYFSVNRAKFETALPL
ncbi:Lrp/AsnC family transcriptional regulator [Massilia sp. W12]|uniref:Lrp/AsnC family transcriptional regulator n=1 Tax=Massilia sp. W12 TaxID=3126507 RepID=UPI0030D2F7BF